jgi:DNA repair protein RadA/Sms
MKPPSVIFSCGSCDAQSQKWTGQCLECGAWGTMSAETAPTKTAAAAKAVAATKPAAITAFNDLASERERRIPTGITEADRVFGGGIVPGSVTLLGGEPGIGKSTLALMIASNLAASGKKTLYVSGEESASQIKMRAERLGVAQKNLFFLNETDVTVLAATITAEKPAFAVIDSVQMLRCDDVPAEAGAVGQVRAAAGRLVSLAKSSGIPLLLIGHVTKDGIVAGPKTLEHIVDTVLSFEGERTHPLRTLRSLKNRFGSTDEAGIFEMNDVGLAEIKNPSAYLLEARLEGVPGSAISCVMEGTRPVLVEIQALVQKTSFGYPSRKSSGVDQSRVDMLLAVLGRRAGLDFGQYDVFVNVVGGLKVKEPAADLAIALALASAFRHVALPPRLVAWGEVGLGGEIRPVPGHDRRLAETAALGMTDVVAGFPRTAAKKPAAGIRAIDARTIKDAIAATQNVVATARR